jgi:hypothetical protein
MKRKYDVLWQLPTTFCLTVATAYLAFIALLWLVGEPFQWWPFAQYELESLTDPPLMGFMLIMVFIYAAWVIHMVILDITRALRN